MKDRDGLFRFFFSLLLSVLVNYQPVTVILVSTAIEVIIE